jgi:tyrosyl-tRNA synthetase
MVKESGISYAEFSYQLLQAYDFLHLFNNHNCTIQLGGSDQWGNITAGLDLIKKSREMGKNLKHPLDSDNEMAFGITIPLITTNTGEKFGKSEGNAIWLDKSLLSVYDFYQVILNLSSFSVKLPILKLKNC